MEKKDWLQEQIKKAQESVKERPDWMKETSHFQGGDRKAKGAESSEQKDN